MKRKRSLKWTSKLRKRLAITSHGLTSLSLDLRSATDFCRFKSAGRCGKARRNGQKEKNALTACPSRRCTRTSQLSCWRKSGPADDSQSIPGCPTARRARAASSGSSRLAFSWRTPSFATTRRKSARTKTHTRRSTSDRTADSTELVAPAQTFSCLRPPILSRTSSVVRAT